MTFQEVLDRIWSDEALRQRLIADPKPVLREFGLQIPDSKSVQVHENTLTVLNVVLPVKPDGEMESSNDPVGKTIQRAWSDPDFKARLLADPRDAAAEMGVRIPLGTEVQIWENTPSVEHIILPLDPAANELSDADLEAVAGGGSSKGSQGPSCNPGLLQGLPTMTTFSLTGQVIESPIGAIAGNPTITPQSGKH